MTKTTTTTNNQNNNFARTYCQCGAKILYNRIPNLKGQCPSCSSKFYTKEEEMFDRTVVGLYWEPIYWQF